MNGTQDARKKRVGECGIIERPIERTEEQMSAKKSHVRRAARRLHRISRQSARVVKKTFVTLGDLVSAAYEVGGSEEGAAVLLSPLSPLYHLLGRRIVLAA
jgi:hypothetical protein